jgi:hypothetical protein
LRSSVEETLQEGANSNRDLEVPKSPQSISQSVETKVESSSPVYASTSADPTCSSKPYRFPGSECQPTVPVDPPPPFKSLSVSPIHNEPILLSPRASTPTAMDPTDPNRADRRRKFKRESVIVLDVDIDAIETGPPMVPLLPPSHSPVSTAGQSVGTVLRNKSHLFISTRRTKYRSRWETIKTAQFALRIVQLIGGLVALFSLYMATFNVNYTYVMLALA